MKATVSERALVARIRRALAKEDQDLKACRENSRSHHDLGDWYIINVRSNSVRDTHCDLASLAHQLGVLAGHEEIVFD